MCGRYAQFGQSEELKCRFALEEVPAATPPNYNAALTQLLPVITAEEPPALQFFRWGLIPSWAKDKAFGNSLMNARCETIEEKPAFRSAFTRRRCLVPANGFFEWKKEGNIKQPYFFCLDAAAKSLFSMAGIWDEWCCPDTGEVIRSFAIITTAANADVEHVHNRMSVIFTDREKEQLWLSAGTDKKTLRDILQPLPTGTLTSYKVHNEVSSARAQGKHLIEPITDTSQQTLLFGFS